MKPIFLKIHSLSTGTVLIAIYVISLFGPANLFAGNKTDSLLKILNTKDLGDSEQSNLYYQIAKTYYESNNDSARYFATNGLVLARKSNYIKGAINNSLILGHLGLKTDSLIKARNYYLEIVELSDKSQNVQTLLTAWLMLGLTCDLLADHSKSMEYYYKGLHFADSLNSKFFQSRFYNNIAIIYNKTGDDRKAINYFKRAAAIFKDIDDEEHYANTLLNIGGIYSNLNSIDSALIYLNKSKETNEKLNNHYGLLNYYANIGEIEFKKKDYEKALIGFQHQLEEIKKLDDSFFGSRSYLKAGAILHLADVYSKLGEYVTAIENYRKVILFATESSFLGSLAKANKGLGNVYEKIGNTDSALVYFKLFLKYNDSLNQEENVKRIAELELGYESQKEERLLQYEKEKALLAQKTKGIIYMSIIGASISGLLIFLLLYIRQKDKHKRSLLKEQNLQLEKENLANKLEFKNKELTTNAMYLLKKNEFISVISNKLKDADCNSKLMQPRVIVDIISELDKNTSSEVWSEFETRFQDIYGDFYKKLNEKFPDLTPNELKLSAFLKLNMSSKEISAITYQSTETLKTARHRLRKKLGLKREDNLVAFLNQV